jgi:hypothetical protein
VLAGIAESDVVTDRNGRPVQGLHRETFPVDEDGQGSKITSSEEHVGTRSAPSPANLPGLPPNVFTNASLVDVSSEQDAAAVLSGAGSGAYSRSVEIRQSRSWIGVT